MNSTKLTSKDICEIVEACSKSGVSKITLGKLAIEFTLRPMEYHIALPQVPPSDQREIISEQVSAQSRQDSIDDLMISDPAAYEKALLSGELDEGRVE